MPKYTYKKANRILQDAQSLFCSQIPTKYDKIVSRIINCEYVLTMLEEGHEPDTYQDTIDDIVKIAKSK